MQKELLGFVLIGLLGMSGCSREAGAPPAQQDNSPKFWQDATIRIRFAGSRSNLSLISRYIAEGMHRRLGSGFVFSIFGGGVNDEQTYYTNLVALSEGEVDFAMTTPPVYAKMAMDGKGYFTKPYPNLRAIAAIPQNDWLGCMVPAELGVNSFEDIKTSQIPLRLATGPMDIRDGVGFLVERLLEAYGISIQDLESWGGELIAVSGAPEAAQKVLSGEANAACHEYWKAFYPLTDEIPLNFLPISDEVLNRLSREYGYQKNVIPRGIYGPNVPDRDIPTVDYSDWIMLVNSRVSDDLAYLAAQVAVEDRAGYEILYAGREERRQSLDVPMKPEEMWKNVGVPLHPGAEKYYREAGFIR